MSLPLTHSPADVLRWILISINIGTDPLLEQAWPIFCASEPDLPDNAITTYDTEGFGDGKSMVDGEAYTHFGGQIRVRSRDHPVGAGKIYSIRQKVSEQINNSVVTIDGKSYLIPCFAKLSGVNSIGAESPSSRRQIYTINGIFVVRALN